MGTFGASHYSLNFFIDFHAKLPSFDDRPEAVSLADGWKGLGLTYLLLKGLKNASKTFQLISDSAEGSSKNDGLRTSTGSRYASRSVTAKNPVRACPIPNKNTAGYGLGKLFSSKSKLSSHTKAYKSDTLGVCGEQKNMIAEVIGDFSESALYEAATRSSEELKFLTEKSLREFNLGVEGVMTTITGLSRKVHYKNEMKEIITVVKTADRVVQGVKAANGFLQTFSSPIGDLLALGAGANGVVLGMNTVKIVLRGVKISKGLTTVTKLCKNRQTGAIGVGAEMAIKAEQNLLGQRFKVIVKGLKASEGAANVLIISKEVGKTLGMLDQAELLSWNLIMKGFKFTKSAIRVLEPVGSLHWGVMSVVRNGILEVKGAVEGVGVVVKAVVISQELYMVILKCVGFTKGTMAAFEEYKRRSSLAKRLSEQPPEVSNSSSEDDFSGRTEVSFKDLLQGQFVPSSVNWTSTEAERKSSSSNGWMFSSHSYTTKDMSFCMTTPEPQRNIDTNFLPLLDLTLTSCLDFQSCVETPHRPGLIFTPPVGIS